MYVYICVYVWIALVWKGCVLVRSYVSCSVCVVSCCVSWSSCVAALEIESSTLWGLGLYFQELSANDEKHFLQSNQVLAYVIYGTYIDSFSDPQAQYKFLFGLKDIELFHQNFSKILTMDRFVVVNSVKDVLPHVMKEDLLDILSVVSIKCTTLNLYVNWSQINGNPMWFWNSYFYTKRDHSF